MSKLGAIGRHFTSLLSFLLRITLKLLWNVALVVSVGITVYTIGDYTWRIIKERKPVLDIIYWRDPKKSGVALALILLALILFAKFSFISLLAYTSLAVLGGTLGFRIFKLVEGRVKNTDGSNPFKPYLEQEVSVPQDRVHAQVDVLVEHAQLVATQLRRLFLVEHLVDSVKFALLLWTLTYVGAWFSGLALIIIFVLGVFSIPKFYEVYKEPVDHYLDLARENVEKVNHIIEEKVPFLKRQQEVKKEQ
jgi:hypothetical protein